MHTARTVIGVGIQRTVQRIVVMCTDERHVLAHPRDKQRMVIGIVTPSKLDNVTRLRALHGYLMPKRSYLHVIYQKVIQIRHTRPCRRIIALCAVEPTKGRCFVHDTASRKQALRNEIGTVAAECIKTGKQRIAGQRPCPCILHSMHAPIRFDGNHKINAPLHAFCCQYTHPQRFLTPHSINTKTASPSISRGGCVRFWIQVHVCNRSEQSTYS